MRILIALLAVLTLTTCQILKHGAKAHADDGVTLVFDIHPKGDPALVFVHGWAADRQYWHHQVAPFVERHTVVLMDLAGHGDSGDGREDWTLSAFAGDVESVIEELDLESVILVGHSMGGFVALDVARRMPDTVVAVIGVDTLHDAQREISQEELDGALAMFETDWEGTMGSMLGTLLAPETDEEVGIWILDRASLAHRGPALASLRLFPQLDIPELFRNAGVPIRCINSAPGAAPGNYPTEIERNRQYADYDAVLMDRTGHYPMLERPQLFNAKLAEIVAGLAAQ